MGLASAAWTIEGTLHEPSGVLVDDARGVRWDTGFLTTNAGEVFVSVHDVASGTPRGAFVVCSPILAEAARNYRREVLLADGLAERGIVAARFHYRGTGHSDDVDALTLDSLVDDARSVAAHLAKSGVERIGFVGTRLGALVAARMHAERGEAPLMLWDPAVDGGKYLRELLRARLMTNLKSGGIDGGVRGLRAQLDSGHAIEISGYPLTPELYESVRGVDLASLLGEPRAPLCIHELNGAGKSRPEVDALLARWRDAGHATDSSVVTVDEPWWFGASARMDTYEGQATAISLVAATVAFADGCLGEAS